MSGDGARLLQSARAVMQHKGSELERQAAYPDFYNSHPRLFEIICSGRCDLHHLETMVKLLADIEAGEKTVEEASSVIANRLNLTYIESVIGPPTPEQALKPGMQTEIKVVEGDVGQKRPRP